MKMKMMNAINVLRCLRNTKLFRNYSDYPCPRVKFPRPVLDFDFLLDPQNKDKIIKNMKNRKGVGDLDKVYKIADELKNLNLDLKNSVSNTMSWSQRQQLWNLNKEQRDALKNLLEMEIEREALKIPNMSHSEVEDMGEEPTVIFKKEFKARDFKLRTFEDISRMLSGCRMANLALMSGERTYYLTGVLAELEQALISYTVDHLLQRGFSLISVPDILHPSIIEGCGMATGERTQVYSLDSKYGEASLSGTAEMAIGGYLLNKDLDPSELPLKLAAVSRCYRAETSRVQEEKGLYRVHQFTKVEMFCVTAKGGSEAALGEVLQVERELFDQLGLSYRLLDMCPAELGSPAHRKYDIEAWMPGRQGGFWGEISSCSDCTDYQARRLGVTSGGEFCHTVNGTACAVPRMIISLCEQNQTVNGTVELPEVLHRYMNGKQVMEPKPKKQRPNFTFINSAKFFEKQGK